MVTLQVILESSSLSDSILVKYLVYLLKVNSLVNKYFTKMFNFKEDNKKGVYNKRVYKPNAKTHLIYTCVKPEKLNWLSRALKLLWLSVRV